MTKKECVLKQPACSHHPLVFIVHIILFLAIIGALISVYSTYIHFSKGKSFCSVNEKYDCDKVNRSTYSVILRVPVAIIGFIGYLIIGLVAFVLLGYYDFRKIYKKLRARHIISIAALCALIGFGFSVYLTYIQAVVLNSWCVTCVTSFVIVTLILLLSIADFFICVRCKDILTKVDMKSRSKICKYC